MDRKSKVPIRMTDERWEKIVRLGKIIGSEKPIDIIDWALGLAIAKMDSPHTVQGLTVGDWNTRQATGRYEEN